MATPKNFSTNSWAWGLRGLTGCDIKSRKVAAPAKRLVLVRLADRADEASLSCWTMISTLTDETDLSESVVQRALRSLAEDDGLIATIPMRFAYGSRHQRSSLYVLNPLGWLHGCTTAAEVIDRVERRMADANPGPDGERVQSPLPRNLDVAITGSGLRIPTKTPAEIIAAFSQVDARVSPESPSRVSPESPQGCHRSNPLPSNPPSESPGINPPRTSPPSPLSSRPAPTQAQTEAREEEKFSENPETRQAGHRADAVAILAQWPEQPRSKSKRAAILSRMEQLLAAGAGRRALLGEITDNLGNAKSLFAVCEHRLSQLEPGDVESDTVDTRDARPRCGCCRNRVNPDGICPQCDSEPTVPTQRTDRDMIERPAAQHRSNTGTSLPSAATGTNIDSSPRDYDDEAEIQRRRSEALAALENMS